MASKLPKRKITIYYIQYIEVEEIVLTEDDFPLQNQYIGAVNMEYVNISKYLYKGIESLLQNLLF